MTLAERLKEHLLTCQGQEVTIDQLRRELQIDPTSEDYGNLRVQIHRAMERNLLKPEGKRAGVYKVIKQIDPVRVFVPERERRKVWDFKFPRDVDTGEQISIAEKIVVRAGDLITIGGVKSKGKTTFCLNLAAENIDQHPVLMGNEYTRLISSNGSEHYEPDERFLARLERMSEWVQWTDSAGRDKFELYPIADDYASYVQQNRINLIDWINLDGAKLYDIGRVLEDIKKSIGKGIAVAILQKGESATLARGGQFVRDFSDLEILLDGYGPNDDDILLTVKGCKEKRGPIVGKTVAYTIVNGGTQFSNFREVFKCRECRGTGYKHNKECDCYYGYRESVF